MRHERLYALTGQSYVLQARVRPERTRDPFLGCLSKFQSVVISRPPIGAGTSRKQSIPISTQIAIKAVLSAREYVFFDKLSNATLGQTEIERNLFGCSPSTHGPSFHHQGKRKSRFRRDQIS
jgi:hypothetical protein